MSQRTPSRTGAASHLPVPVSKPQSSPAPASDVGSASLNESRRRQNKKDEQIRKKLENELQRKRGPTTGGRARTSRKAQPGTVMALKPSPALQIKPNTTVSEAAQLMAAKREDCVLVTDDDDRISGIFTAKDLAFRVVGQGVDARDITIAQIMTKNPLCARTDTSATDALELMVSKGFRHLPVMDENQDISGILDITKCFYEAMEKLERAYSSSRKLYDALEGVQSELGSSQPQQIIQYVEALRHKMSGPTLESVLNGVPPTTVSVRTTVREAAALMKENRTTAVLVQDQGNITGIFTSKDVVLRVIAPGLDPAKCSVVRVMTPHPDFAPMDMTIQDALRKMHDGHYLNLPVMNDAGEIVGMADVLKLTYATLEQISSMNTGDSEGPAWNKFWLSLDNDTESVMSDGTSHRHHGRPASTDPALARQTSGFDSSVLPTDSASHVGDHSPPASHLSPHATHHSHHNPEDVPFPFKFKAPSGRVHRLQVIPSAGFIAVLGAIVEKLGGEIEQVGGEPEFSPEGKMEKQGFALSYIDDEGDVVSISNDQDLVDAIEIARHKGRDKVDLFVHDPSNPPQPAVPEPVRQTTPRPKRDETDDEEEVPLVKKKRGQAPPAAEQVIPGVPNDLLLPGAIGALAVSIILVFTISRLTSN